MDKVDKEGHVERQAVDVGRNEFGLSRDLGRPDWTGKRMCWKGGNKSKASQALRRWDILCYLGAS